MKRYDEVFDSEDQMGLPENISITYRDRLFNRRSSSYDEQMTEFIQEIEDTINELDDVYWVDRDTTRQGSQLLYKEVWIYHRVRRTDG